jgi:hypothetical protein
MNSLFPSCACLLAFLLEANVASGQVVLSPVAVVGSDLGSYDPTTSLENMINQSGIIAPFVSGTTDFSDYFANPGRTFAANGGRNNWQSNFSFDLPLKGYVDFDLGASYAIDRIATWNVSVKEVTVRIADDVNALETSENAGSFTLVNHLNFPFSYSVDVLSLTKAHQGRYVRLAIDSAYTFSPSDSFAYAIIGEVVMSVTRKTAPLSVRAILNANGDVTIIFTGTLQTSNTPDGSFADLIENPQGIYTLTKENLSSQQYFRVRGN